MANRLWLTGYRAWELNVYGDQDPKLTVIKYSLRNHLVDWLETGGQWVIGGGELGIEQWGLETAISLKPDYPDLKVALMLPFTDFGNRWNESNQKKLQELITKVDFSAPTSKGPYQNPAQLSGYTRFMCQHTDQALLVYDPDFEGKAKFAYHQAQAEAKRRDYPVSLITMPDLEEAGRDYADSHPQDSSEADQ